MKDEGVFYIVSTPIGHLKDISFRAIDVLKEVDLIAAEDTRHSRHLLNHYSIRTSLMSLHEHNESERLSHFVKIIQSGQSIALISDAGTPLISDPGHRLVKALIEHKITVVPIPGPCAVIAALSVSGLSSEAFIFLGFLSAKGERRKKQCQALSSETRTVVLYESVHRIKGLFQLLVEYFEPARRIVIARELTKQYETIVRTTVADLVQGWDVDTMGECRGEFVVMIEGYQEEEKKVVTAKEEHMLSVLLKELSPASASRVAAQLTGMPKRALYDEALRLQSKKTL